MELSGPAKREMFFNDIRTNIQKHGQFILNVFNHETYGSFGYTIGNRQRGLPDLLIMGAGPTVAGHVLNQLAQLQVDRGESLENGEIFSAEMFGLSPAAGSAATGGPGYQLKIVHASDEAKRECTIQTGQFYRDEFGYELVQVVISDSEGRFPDNAECDPKAIVSVFAESPGERREPRND